MKSEQEIRKRFDYLKSRPKFPSEMIEVRVLTWVLEETTTDTNQERRRMA